MPILLDSDIFEAAITDSVTLRYRCVGTGPRSVILLHGFGASMSTWTPLVSLLDDSLATYYLVDLKGFGQSSKPQDDAYSPHDQASLVATFITSRFDGPLTLVGHSYGGTVALLTAALLQSRSSNVVDSVVIIDGLAYNQRVPMFISALTHRKLTRLFIRIPSRRVVARLLRTFVYDSSIVDDEMIDRYVLPLGDASTAHALTLAARQLVSTSSQRILDAITNIQVPALVIWGDKDPLIAISSGRRLAGDMAASRFVGIDLCGHMPHEEAPRITADAINSFLRDLAR